MSSEEHNGWTNRETWATALHINNDQMLQEIALEYAEQEIAAHDEGETINSYYFGQLIRDWIEGDLLTLENIAGNQGLFSMLTDIGSLYRVNWTEIGEAFLNDAKEASK